MIKDRPWMYSAALFGLSDSESLGQARLSYNHA